jgi:LPS-assembly protein
MRQLHKFNLKNCLAGTLTAVIGLLIFTLTWKTANAHNTRSHFDSYLTTNRDTTKPLIKRDTIPKRVNLRADSLDAKPLSDSVKPEQKIDTFSFKVSKDSLDAPVSYQAEDSAVILIKDKKIILYGKTKTDYKDIELTAPKVELNQATQIVTAFNSHDSTGTVLERAHFKQGEQEFQADTIQFNFKTQKGLTRNTYTQPSPGVFVKTEYAKMVNKTTMYAKNGVMTTCNLDDPHFGFHYDKIKIINNKIAVSGPIHPEFEGVPLPIYLPFGIFPMNKGRHSGFIPPQFATNEQYGLGLEGIGYYHVLNQYFDVTVRSNIYSYGGWSVAVTPTYRRRYRYNGSLNLSMQSTKVNFKGDPDFSKNRTYFVNWTHSVDSRARPGTNFSANVSAGSTRYNRLVPNSPQRNFQNQLQSSINYSKTWIGKPYNFSMSANHNQNDYNHFITLNLPSLAFSVNTLYPFQKKDLVGTPKWYEKLGISYQGSFTNSVSFYDTLKYGKNGVKPFFKYLLDTAQWSAHHSIPISLSLPPILNGKLIVAPGVSYSQDWIQRATRYQWNSSLKKVDTTTAKGIFINQQASFSLSFNTAIFGLYQFEHSKIMAIRHTVRPSIGFNYVPDFNSGHLRKVQVDTTGREFLYNDIGGGIIPFTTGRRQANLSFSIENTLEMKYHSKKDTANAGIKKIRLIDGYGFNVNYNLLADSFRLSTANLYLRSTLFEKINITAGANYDPYDFNAQGFPVNKLFRRKGKFSLGRITSANLALSANFKSKPKDPEKAQMQTKSRNDIVTDPSLIDQQNLLDYMRQNPAEFVDFNIPWTLGTGLSLYYSQRLRADFKGFEKKFTANMNFNGSVNLTSKWNMSVDGYYDFDTKKLQTFQMNITRDMHCWQMAIGVVPVGLYRYFNISISPKASILQDLKINRTRYFSDF